MFGYEVYAKWVVATAAVVTLLLHFTSSLLLASEDLYESAQVTDRRLCSCRPPPL